ncbi:MAG: hypothetical protein HC915_03970 [Anaerolineae bacterium]|nr:hypothetical protein [Anaerolineae bacterium]
MTQDGQRRHGPNVVLVLDQPLEVVEGADYVVSLVADQPLTSLGTVVATEGDWDDHLPYNVCPLLPGTELSRETPSGYTEYTCIAFSPFPGYYHGINLYIIAEDDPLKRDLLLQGLDEADYLTISSNRFYDGVTRIPDRWPLTERYYEALFGGELGFELALEWTSYPRLGPLEWKNQVLPTDDLPGWLNEFEVEEAFTVYDHPAVFVFRKTPDYAPKKHATSC